MATDERLRVFRREMAKLQRDYHGSSIPEVQLIVHRIEQELFKTFEEPPQRIMIVPTEVDGVFREFVYEFKEMR